MGVPQVIPLGFVIEIEYADLAGWAATLGRRAARSEILPILKAHMAPVVSQERAALATHTKSGALSQSLQARSGGGDKPGTMSVFAAPYATSKQLAKTWGQGRAQQQAWARKKSTKGRGRRAVFYAPMVERGHRIVKRRASGELYQVREQKTVAVRFAAQAVPTLEQQADKAADAILRHITGI